MLQNNEENANKLNDKQTKKSDLVYSVIGRANRAVKCKQSDYQKLICIDVK